MIQLPHRAVTRFFIPLIDVLILLFCIFLLLPFVSKQDGEDGSETAQSKALAEAKEKLELAEAQVKALMNERATLADRMSVRVLEIDLKTAHLFYYNREGPEPVRTEVKNQADAQLMIDRWKQTAKGKQVYFQILRPRELTTIPSNEQLKEWGRWFKDVPYGYEDS